MFPLAARRQGIVPLWASEIEKAPISITKRHFPDMEHLGDITRLHGGEVPPVDIITFGSPCQNLSSAGRREGLGGAKSSLFFQAVRIIEEMRDATGGQFPTIVIWENVMGALLSGNRLDFRAVLQSLTDAEIPMPASGRWANAGMVRGGGRDVCWRLLDAQHWADPRLARRQRVFAWPILEADVPERSCLSPAACSRLLRLAETLGCPPPEAIEYLLLKQGGRYQSSTPFKATVCGGRPRRGTLGTSWGALENQQTLFPP